MYMDIEIFEVGPFLENTYLLSKEGECILIDPGFAAETEYQRFKLKLNGELKAIVLTHAHVDHVMGLSRVLVDFKVPVYLNSGDLYLWQNFGNQAQMFGLQQNAFSFTPEALPVDEPFNIGKFEFECIYTPGHSPDHTSFYFESNGILIAGDVLFRESIGRTDLYKGDFDVLAKSIREKLYLLPETTVVYPGHGPETTIGYEKQNNAFVKAQ